MRNHSNENVFQLHVHFHANQSHFHLYGFARRLVLKLRQKATRKWPIALGQLMGEVGGVIFFVIQGIVSCIFMF